MIDFRNNDKAKINTRYNPPQKIQDDRMAVYKRYAQMKQGRSEKEAKWDKWEKQYESWRPPKNSADWQSNIVPPFTTTVVERALAEVIDQTLQPKVVGRGPEDVIRAKIMNFIKDYTWEIGDGDLELYASIKQGLILGETVWQEDYWRDKRVVKLLKKFDPTKNIEEYIEKDIDDFDDVYGENVDLRNFFKDEMAKTINRGRYKANDCIRRYIMNLDTFRENFIGSIHDQFGVAKLVEAGGDLNNYQFYKPPEGIDKDNQVEVLWYWGRRPDKLIITANDIVIRDGPNPFNHKQLPFAEGRDVPRLNDKGARGEPELLESIQDELTTLRRMRIDRQHMDIWKMFLVSNRETLDDDDAIVAPSRFLYVDDPNNSIKALEYGPTHQTAYLEEDRLKQDGREVTGIESPQASGTATEAAIFKESTMKALRLKIWLMSRELVTGIARLRVANISQYYSTPKAVKIVGQKKMAEYRQIRTTDVELRVDKRGQLLETEKKGEHFFVVAPDLVVPLYGSFDFKTSGEPTFPVSKPLQQQKMMEFVANPIIQRAVDEGYYSASKIADAMSETMDYDPEKFKATPVEEEPMIDGDVALELANRENEILMKGGVVNASPDFPQGTGTPYATRAHTNIHLAFMGSPSFKQEFNDQIMQNFTRHVLWEEKEQMARNQAQMPPQNNMSELMRPSPRNQGQGIMAGEAKAAMPARTLGSENLPM